MSISALFVDDTILLIIDNDRSALKHKLKNGIKELDAWFHYNNFIINVGKTITISFHTTQNRLLVRPQISLKNMVITCKT
jgi:hypothetical protein